jgi:hypothetical protein
MEGGDDQFRVDQNELTVLRNEKAIVRVRKVVTPVSAPAAPPAVAKKTILIDASKDGGTWWFPQGKTYDPKKAHQGKVFADGLARRGWEVRELAPGDTITDKTFEKVDLVLRPQFFSAYSEAEVQAYRAAVDAGLRLILIVSPPGTAPDGPAAGFGIATAKSQELGEITDMADHRLAKSVNWYKGAWTVLDKLPDGAVSLAGLNGKEHVVAAVVPRGRGTVFAFGAFSIVS